MLPSLKEETTIRKIARTYDQERAYNMYISKILKQRKTTSLAVKTLKQRKTTSLAVKTLKQRKTTSLGVKTPRNNRMQILTLHVENKLLTVKSPDEETCNVRIKNCVHHREQLLSQLYTVSK